MRPRINPLPEFGITVVTLLLCLLGAAAFFAFVLPDLAPMSALLALLPILPAALCAEFLTRRWAGNRAARIGDDRPLPLGPATLGPGTLGPGTPGAGASFDPCIHGRTLPPHDLLESGERLLLWLRSDRTPEPQMLIATDRRVVVASIIENGSSFILVQASTGTLLGGSSDYQGRDLVTSALFSDRAPMRILGGDPSASARFAGALSDLARSRTMLR